MKKIKKISKGKVKESSLNQLLIIAVFIILTILSLIIVLKTYSFYRGKRISASLEDGKNYYKQGEYRGSIDALKKGLKLDSNNLEIMLLLGRVYEAAGRTDEAKETYREVLEVETKNEESLYRLSVIYSSEGNIDESLNLLETALTENPDFISARLLRAQLYLETDALEKAEEEFIYVIENKPYGFDMFSVYFGLGQVYFESSKNDKAREYWEKALDIRPDDEKIKKLLEHI
ncbi:MAG: tetratricopeptide repeat protein [Actinomycetia bacterium]|nr:tetratricopeptide repeat protein [Actinomycetes bacterium]